MAFLTFERSERFSLEDHIVEFSRQSHIVHSHPAPQFKIGISMTHNMSEARKGLLDVLDVDVYRKGFKIVMISVPPS